MGHLQPAEVVRAAGINEIGSLFWGLVKQDVKSSAQLPLFLLW